MKIVDKVKEALESSFPDADLDIEYTRRGCKTHGFLIWQGFDGIDQLDRQRKLWEVLRDKLGKDTTRVSYIFTYTPREYKAMTAH